MEVDIWNIVMSYDLPDSIQLDLRFFFYYYLHRVYLVWEIG